MSLTRKVALNTTVLAVGRVVTACAGLLTVGISTRYLGIDAYGALVTAVALITVVGALGDVGVSAIGAREIAKRPDETERLLGGVFTATLFLTVPVAVVGVATALIAYSGPSEELQRYGVLFLLAPLPLGALAITYGGYFVAQQKAYLGTISSVGAAATQLLVLVLAVSLDLGYLGVVAAYASQAVASSAISVLIGARLVRIRPWLDLKLGKQLFLWALPIGVDRLIATLYARFDILMLSLMATERAVGLYGLAFRLVDILTLLPTYAMVTLLPEFARLSEIRDRFDYVFSMAMSVMQTAAVGLIAFFLVFADEVVQIVGGPGFAGAANVLRILMVGAGLAYVSVVFGQSLIALNHQKRLLILSFTGFPVNALGNIALIPVLGATGAAIAFVATEVFSVVVLAILYRGVGRKLPVPQRVPQTLAAACLAGSVALFKLVPVEGAAVPWLTVGIGGVAFVAIYVGSLYALRAMPPVIHQNLVLPAWGRLQGSVRTAAVKVR